MDNRANGISFVAGAIVGGTIGALAGILFAPTSGYETRARIRNASNQAIADAQGKMMDYKETAIDPAMVKMKNQIKDQASKVSVPKKATK